MMLIPLLLLLVGQGSAYKFLAYSPQFANSHVNFLGKISDTLIDAGHDVVMVSTIFDTFVGGPGTQKARVIELPQSRAASEFQEFYSADGGKIIWESENLSDLIEKFGRFSDAFNAQCNETFNHPGLLHNLKEEKFDAAYSEALDVCGFALFYALGIEKVAVTNTMSLLDWSYHITQLPTFLSYTPTIMSGHFGEDMSFSQRVENVIAHFAMIFFNERVTPPIQETFERLHPGIPHIDDIMANVSLIFHNSEPLTDFPHLTSAKNIDIGGITVSSEHKKLNQTWSDILDLRPRTILISFGTFAKAYLMPAEYKQTIRKTVKRFPDVTFIFKYEKPEHNLSGGVPNLIESTWVPQKDMLYDGRLTAFVTHCGQGSTMEANKAGVPLVVIPIAGDQIRNAHTVKRNGLGVVLDKTLLSSPDALEQGIREVINNPRYAEKAKRVARMLRKRPFSMEETFVRHMEFLAEHGPLRQLDHYGARLNFFQFYLLDIVAFFVGLSTVVLAVLLYITRTLLSFVITIQKQKYD